MSAGWRTHNNVKHFLADVKAGQARVVLKWRRHDGTKAKLRVASAHCADALCTEVVVRGTLGTRSKQVVVRYDRTVEDGEDTYHFVKVRVQMGEGMERRTRSYFI
jgi:hypothetical protein